MNRKVVLLLVFCLAFTSMAAAFPRPFLKPEVTWTPDQPEPNDYITVTVSTEETNVSGIVLQVCVKTEDNYVCRIPDQMVKLNNLYTHSFYINDTAEVHLNLTLQYEDGSEMYDNSTSLQVTTASDDGNGNTPGFGYLMAMVAAGLIAVLVRRRQAKF